MTCISQMNVCVRTLAALDRLNIVCLHYDGCIALGIAGCSVSYHILHCIPERISSLKTLYRSLCESVSLPQPAGVSQNDSPWLIRLTIASYTSAPILYSGHTLMLHFTCDTHHVAPSGSVSRHHLSLRSPVLSVTARDKQL